MATLSPRVERAECRSEQICGQFGVSPLLVHCQYRGQRTNGVSAPYQRRDVVFTAQEIEPFAGLLNRELGSARTAAELKVLRMSQGVAAETVIDNQSAARPVYDPDHPDANGQGYVLYPNVSVVKEMSDMIAASHSYEANMAVLQTSLQIIERSLRLSS